jgi:hypothetical protein
VEIAVLLAEIAVVPTGFWNSTTFPVYYATTVLAAYGAFGTFFRR